ncbi:MAG: SHOCT domain-containing protein [Actinomycetota bacterium]|nr:SHOCT domain-containing protein [Actinomycetota bacterium]
MFSVLIADSDGLGHMWGWGGGMLLGWVFMTLLLAVAGWLVYTLARGAESPSRRNESSALDVLDTRYARGEIEREEYLERRADLE